LPVQSLAESGVSTGDHGACPTRPRSNHLAVWLGFGMTRDEICLRLSWYRGFIYQALGDISYGDRCIRPAHLMSDEECLRILVEIQERLVAAGIIKPDEDPFSEQIKLIGY
jgi:hypothetical protein